MPSDTIPAPTDTVQVWRLLPATTTPRLAAEQAAVGFINEQLRWPMFVNEALWVAKDGGFVLIDVDGYDPNRVVTDPLAPPPAAPDPCAALPKPPGIP